MPRIKRTRVARADKPVVPDPRLLALNTSPIVLEVPDRAEIGSPCPSSSRKRKRTALASAIRIVPQCPATPATIELRDVESTGDEDASEGNAKDVTKEIQARADSSGPSWRYFTVNICSCMDQHSLHSYALPASALRKWRDLDTAIASMSGEHCSNGTLTDLEGNELYNFPALFEAYIDCGLMGVIWHEAYFADVELGNRRLAQNRVKECLAQQRQQSFVSMDNNQNHLSHNSGHVKRRTADCASDYSELVTPPPPRVTTQRSPSPEPWTAQTSSSGRITQLQSCNKIIQNQYAANIFDDADTVWPITPEATSDAAPYPSR